MLTDDCQTRETPAEEAEDEERAAAPAKNATAPALKMMAAALLADDSQSDRDPAEETENEERAADPAEKAASPTAKTRNHGEKNEPTSTMKTTKDKQSGKRRAAPEEKAEVDGEEGAATAEPKPRKGKGKGKIAGDKNLAECTRDLSQLQKCEPRCEQFSYKGSNKIMQKQTCLKCGTTSTYKLGQDKLVVAPRPAAAAQPALGQDSGVSRDAGTSTKATVAARVSGVDKNPDGKSNRGPSTQKGENNKKKLHGPVRKRPACKSSRPAVVARPDHREASGVSPSAGTSAAKGKDRRHPRGRTALQKQLDKMDAKYPWGRKGEPPPTSEAERKSLANQIARLRQVKANFARPDRADDDERLAHAEAMLNIMRGKARAGFGGGRAMATHGLSLNRSAGLALAQRARKLAKDLETHFDPERTPNVLIEEGIAMAYEVA